MSAATPLKEQQTRHWDRVAGGWAAWLEWTERNFAPLTEWFQAAAWTDAVNVLDLACGAGYPSLATAFHLRPHGRVVATDISPEMIAAASQRSRESRVENIEFQVMDAEALTLADGSFDAVTNAYGLMFCPDLDRALVEARRVLRPGGRFAAVTWDLAERSPFFHVITRAAAPLLGLQPPSPAAPGPFRLSSPEEMLRTLKSAGFSQVAVQPLAMTFHCGSAAEYLRMFGDLAWGSRIQALPADDRARLDGLVADAVQPYAQDGHLLLSASSWCASAVR